MSTDPVTVVSPVHYPHNVQAASTDDHSEIETLHSHWDADSFGADLRSLRESVQPRSGRAGALVESVAVKNRLVVNR